MARRAPPTARGQTKILDGRARLTPEQAKDSGFSARTLVWSARRWQWL